jgi:hypothetical protein
MKQFCAAVAVAAVTMSGGSVLTAPARAAPPTVTPTPGYDARLQESRGAAPTAPTVYAPAPRAFVRHHHPKRIHDGVH